MSSISPPPPPPRRHRVALWERGAAAPGAAPGAGIGNPAGNPAGNLAGNSVGIQQELSRNPAGIQQESSRNLARGSCVLPAVLSTCRHRGLLPRSVYADLQAPVYGIRNCLCL